MAALMTAQLMASLQELNNPESLLSKNYHSSCLSMEAHLGIDKDIPDPPTLSTTGFSIPPSLISLYAQHSLTMSSPKPEILLIHGAWHTPASYAQLAHAFSLTGLKVHIPILPTASNKTPPTDDLYSDSAFIRSYALSLLDNGTHLIVLMHSYGGQVGTNSLCGLSLSTRRALGKPGGILELIYMAAFAAPEGTSMTGWVSKMGQGELMPVAFDFREDGFVDSRFPRELIVGEGFLSEEEMEAYVATFTTAVGKSWRDEVRECAWREIGVTYLMPRRDKTVPLEYQERFVEGMRESGTRVRVREVDTEHCPNVTATEEVVRIVVEVVGRVGATA